LHFPLDILPFVVWLFSLWLYRVFTKGNKTVPHVDWNPHSHHRLKPRFYSEFICPTTRVSEKHVSNALLSVFREDKANIEVYEFVNCSFSSLSRGLQLTDVRPLHEFFMRARKYAQALIDILPSATGGIPECRLMPIILLLSWRALVDLHQQPTDDFVVLRVNSLGPHHIWVGARPMALQLDQIFEGFLFFCHRFVAKYGIEKSED
jgi:hypothetical protein